MGVVKPKPFFSCIIESERGQGMSSHYLKEVYKKARIEASEESIKLLEAKYELFSK